MSATTCADCCYFDPSNYDEDGYYCEKWHKRVSANTVSCGSFCKAYGRSDSEINNLKGKSDSSGGCFMTTVLCNALGFDDKVSYMEILRKFRKDVLQKYDKFKRSLAMYDVVGPEISKNIESDENKIQIASNIFNLFIKRVCKLVELKKYDEAEELYNTTLCLLAEGYGINDKVSEEYLNNMDVEKSGHGRKVLK